MLFFRTSPKQPRLRRSATLQDLIELDSVSSCMSSTSLLPRPSFECQGDELIAVIPKCTNIFTFTDPSESPSNQDLKRRNLLEILFTIRLNKDLLAEERVLSPLILMLASNLFRPLPPPTHPCVPTNLLDDDPPAMVLTPLWPHLHIVYDILTVVVKNTDAKALCKHINRTFLLDLLGLFHSEDPRERDRLKIIYHQLYLKLTSERRSMRESMRNTFLLFAFHTERHCGVGEMLEIWGSIINGFCLPLKEEHKMFLLRVLLPLHKPKVMQAYHKQLSYCVAQFVKKEPSLGGAVVRGILRCWPVTNCHKEVLLIEELEELVESTPSEHVEELAVPLCSQIARCLTSCNCQVNKDPLTWWEVAERALYVWNNKQFVRMASRFIEAVLPPTVKSLEMNIRWHWSESVKQLTVRVKDLLKEMEPVLYSKCLEELALRESIMEQETIERKKMWESIEISAANAPLFQ